ncbi:DNA/RNA nuclease SfsA [Synechococcales cyanobacterium C]|uniref:Sugar fermentation stimulation protein homolog n=1 Tax=Petrachloros mirabilis ULC683 TaxID=2781853 RepID=A0A8K1ZXU6_9CYAN|nr:DNA/RNA nuclease SfsA [Petrachloros mirabilis]NCJ06102.1 DNA/RNA nuclease SfsA [Petrachloros mirabilis ULC683]
MDNFQVEHEYPRVYEYPPLLAGHLIKRYQRFFADIELETGEIITAHCPNTGPMTGVCLAGSPVQVSVHDNPKRKLKYTWEMIWVDETWVGINTGLPNRVTQRLLELRCIPALADYERLRREVVYGQENSRVDFVLTTAAGESLYVEVKNTTWCQGSLGLFPDTVTTRGQKHLRELKAMLPQTRASMLYFINRGDCSEFAPGDEADPEYGRLLREAVQAGLEVYPCRFEVTPTQVLYLGCASLVL